MINRPWRKRSDRSIGISSHLREIIDGLFIFLLSLSASFCSQSNSISPQQDSDNPADAADQDSGSDVFSSICGNGLIEPGETCDDGNEDDGDRCSSDCKSVDLCPDGVMDGSFVFPNRNDFDLSYVKHCRRIKQDLVLDHFALIDSDHLSELESIEGDLNIGGISDVVPFGGIDLRSFRNLVSVGGDLVISSNESLIDLEGLDNLASVGGDLIIENNNQLTSLQGLNSLTRIEGDFIINHNGFSPWLKGPEKLTHVGGDLAIVVNRKQPDNPFMNASVDCLENLEGQDIREPIDGWAVGCLEGLDGLENLVSVGGSVEIMGEDSLQSLDGLKNLQSVGDEVVIRGTALVDLNPLSSLRSIGGLFAIVNNRLLEELFVPNPSLSIEGVVGIGMNERLPTCGAESFRDALRDAGFLEDAWICENRQDDCQMDNCPAADEDDGLDFY